MNVFSMPSKRFSLLIYFRPKASLQLIHVCYVSLDGSVQAVWHVDISRTLFTFYIHLFCWLFMLFKQARVLICQQWALLAAPSICYMLGLSRFQLDYSKIILWLISDVNHLVSNFLIIIDGTASYCTGLPRVWDLILQQDSVWRYVVSLTRLYSGARGNLALKDSSHIQRFP